MITALTHSVFYEIMKQNRLFYRHDFGNSISEEGRKE